MGLFSKINVEDNTNDSKLISKTEFENAISTLSIMSYLFYNSNLLLGGRNVVMMERTQSYIGIIGYVYEMEYLYGNVNSLVDSTIAAQCAEIKVAMSDKERRDKIISELADNWSDVLQVIFNFTLGPNPTGNEFTKIESDIKNVTKLIEKLSGKKCKTPINPLNIHHKQISYNPYNITEDPFRSQGHILPILTDIFAQELIPQLVPHKYQNSILRGIVADYALSMIESYYNNAGFVPMIIVDQITGQINQVAEMVQRINYEPYSSLKDFLLSQIYK